MKFAGIVTAIATAGTLFLGAPGAVEAQEALPQEPAVEVTDELLERFVAVYPAVVEIAQTAQAELATVEDAEAAQAIQADAQQSITAVLDEGDVAVSEYEAVVMQLQNDPELMAQVEQMLMEQETEDGTGG